jgi:uncharacterized protein YcfJ
MAGINPIAVGILTGGISGAAMGFVVGGPVGAAVGGIGGATVGGISGSEAQRQEIAQKKAIKDETSNRINNQNRLAEEAYKKRKQAQGLGDMNSTAPTGGIASQTGAILTSPTGENTNILG